MKLAFVIAMDSEADTIISQLDCVIKDEVYGRKVTEGRLCGHEIVVVNAGVGKSNAAAATQLAICSYRPNAIVNIGVAGGLNARMQVAGVYQVRATVQYDFDLSQLNHTKVGTLNEYTQREFPLQTLPLPNLPLALVATGDRFNDSEVDYRFLVDDVHADLREMELGAIAHVADRAHIPCYSFKSVSDVHGSGSTTDQFLANLSRALTALHDALPTILTAFPA